MNGNHPNRRYKGAAIFVDHFHNIFTWGSYCISPYIKYSKLVIILGFYQDTWGVQCNTIIMEMENVLIMHSNIIAKQKTFTLHTVQFMVIIRIEFVIDTL